MPSNSTPNVETTLSRLTEQRAVLERRMLIVQGVGGAITSLKAVDGSIEGRDGQKVSRILVELETLFERSSKDPKSLATRATRTPKAATKTARRGKKKTSRRSSPRSRTKRPAVNPLAKKYSVAATMVTPLNSLFGQAKLPETLEEFLEGVYGKDWRTRDWLVLGGPTPEHVSLGEEIAREGSRFKSLLRSSVMRVYDFGGKNVPEGYAESPTIRRLWELAKEHSRRTVTARLNKWGCN